MTRFWLLAVFLTAAPALAQTRYDGEHVALTLPDEWEVMDESLYDGALSMILLGGGEVTIETVDAATPEQAIRDLWEWIGGVEALEGGGAFASEDDGSERYAIVALPLEGGGVIRFAGVIPSWDGDEAFARDLVRDIAESTVLKSSVVGTLASVEESSSFEDLPEVSDEDRAALEEAWADAPTGRQPDAPQNNRQPAAAPSGGVHPVAVFNGGFFVNGVDGFWDLFLMSDGTARRITRPQQGVREYASASIEGDRLILRGPETAVYTFETDRDGDRYIKRQNLSQPGYYENGWPIAPISSAQAQRFVGSFSRSASSRRERRHCMDARWRW